MTHPSSIGLALFIASSVPVRAQTTTLDQLLTHATAHAPMLQVADAVTMEAEADVEAASPLFPANPSVSLALGRRRPNGGLEVQAQLQQQLAIGGQRRSRLRAAARGVDLARGSREQLEWAVRTETRRLAYHAMVAEQQRQLAEQVRELTEQLRDAATVRVNVAEASPLELLVAQADLMQASESEVIARRNVGDVRVQLAALVGWPDDMVPTLVDALPAVRTVPALPLLLRTLAEHSPDLRLRELAIRAAQADLAAANRAAWPNPSVGLYYGREANQGNTNHVWLVTLGVPLPLWRRNTRERARTRARVVSRERERDAATVELRGRLARLRLAVDSAAEQVRLYDDAGVVSVRLAATRIQRAYELGEMSLLEVSQTRQRLLRTLNRRLEARAQYHDAAARLETLLGQPLTTDEDNQ